MRVLTVVVLALWALVATPGEALAEKRVALVIGNGAYTAAGELANPKNDATAMSSSLQRLGFKVTTGIDLDYRAMRTTLSDFATSLEGADVALVFYAGHGIQVAGENYLLPIDAELRSEVDLEFGAVKLDTILRMLESRPRTSLVFLDSCRNNPLTRSLARSMGTRSASVGQGMAEVRSGLGTLITFATQPNDVAADGTGDNSPFTEALLTHIEKPGLEVRQMLSRVRGDVVAATNQRQIPWDHSSLTGDFFFQPAAATSTVTVAPQPNISIDEEALACQALQTATRATPFRSYLREFGDNGQCARYARIRLDQITAISQTQQTQTQQTQAPVQAPVQAPPQRQQTQTSQPNLEVAPRPQQQPAPPVPSARPQAPPRATAGGAWIGLGIRDIDPNLLAANGFPPGSIEVFDVVRAGPGERAGMLAGDIIVSVNDELAGGANAFVGGLSRLRPDDQVTLQIWRNGRIRRVRVVLGETPDSGAPS